MIVFNVFVQKMHSYSEEEMNESEYYELYRKVFDEFDTNNDGKVNINELKTMIERLDLSFPPDFIDRVFQEYHLERSKDLNFEQFFQIVDPHNRKTPLWNSLYEAFKVFDRDSDGLLTIPQLKIALQSLGNPLSDEEFQQLIQFSSPQKIKKDGIIIKLVDYKRLVDTLIRDEPDNEIDRPPECFIQNFISI